eukprot:2549897-Prymnesium_polylepis.1
MPSERSPVAAVYVVSAAFASLGASGFLGGAAGLLATALLSAGMPFSRARRLAFSPASLASAFVCRVQSRLHSSARFSASSRTDATRRSASALISPTSA